MHRVRARTAGGGGLRDDDLREGPGAAQPRQPALRGQCAAAAAPGPRRRRHDHGTGLDAPAVRGSARGRLHLGARRARHEGRRRDARARLPARRPREGRAAGRPRPRRPVRRGGGRRPRRALPGRRAPGAVRRHAVRARRVRRRLARARRQALLSDPGGREADLLAQGDRARAGGSRRDGQPGRHGRAARQAPLRPRPEAAARARDARRAGVRRPTRRGAAAQGGGWCCGRC